MVQAKNLHPHRLSRGGYELLEERIMQDKLKKAREASQSDPALIVDPPSPLTRHEKWKRARQKKSGEYTSEDARLVAEKIVCKYSILIVIVIVISLIPSYTCL